MSLSYSSDSDSCDSSGSDSDSYDSSETSSSEDESVVVAPKHVKPVAFKKDLRYEPKKEFKRQREQDRRNTERMKRCKTIETSSQKATNVQTAKEAPNAKASNAQTAKEASNTKASNAQTAKVTPNAKAGNAQTAKETPNAGPSNNATGHPSQNGSIDCSFSAPFPVGTPVLHVTGSGNHINIKNFTINFQYRDPSKKPESSKNDPRHSN